jgi:SAM-dependent methyltransferase
MSERGGLHRILEFSWVYTQFQTLISRPGASSALREELYPELGSRPLRVLDIGCGPAAFWARYRNVTGISYVGIEPNRAYVEDARRQFADIELHAGTTGDVRDSVHGTFDLVVLEGVLHHIDDSTAREALEFAAERLATGGRLVALDPVLLPRQNPVARMLARFDRGKHVRTLDGYRELALSAFSEDQISVRRLSGQLRVPYDHSVLEAYR